jgi:hypothetical protein
MPIPPPRRARLWMAVLVLAALVLPARDAAAWSDGRAAAPVARSAWKPVVPAASAPEGTEAPLIERHAAKAVEATALAQQVLGPMPAVANTPFLGLALLAGAAVISQSDAVQSSHHPWVVALRDNALLKEARQYASWPLFALLLVLAVLVYLTNTGKIHGTLGKLFRMAEDSSVWVLYGCLAFATFLSTGAATSAPKVAQMGLLELPQGLLLTLAVAVSLAAMMAVRFALDVLIWLSPIPLVDFAFETAKKIVSLGFMALYFWSPFAAASVALVLAVVALFLYGWALRLIRFDFDIILRPWLAKVFPALKTRLVEPRLAARAPGTPGAEVRLAVPAAVLAVKGLPKRHIGSLFSTDAGLTFVSAARLRRARRWACPIPARSSPSIARWAGSSCRSPTWTAASTGWPCRGRWRPTSTPCAPCSAPATAEPWAWPGYSTASRPSPFRRESRAAAPEAETTPPAAAREARRARPPHRAPPDPIPRPAPARRDRPRNGRRHERGAAGRRCRGPRC